MWYDYSGWNFVVSHRRLGDVQGLYNYIVLWGFLDDYAVGETFQNDLSATWMVSAEENERSGIDI